MSTVGVGATVMRIPSNVPVVRRSSMSVPVFGTRSLVWSGVASQPQLVPLVSVSRIDTNGADNSEWRVSCGRRGADYACDATLVQGGGDMRVDVVLLGGDFGVYAR